MRIPSQPTTITRDTRDPSNVTVQGRRQGGTSGRGTVCDSVCHGVCGVRGEAVLSTPLTPDVRVRGAATRLEGLRGGGQRKTTKGRWRFERTAHGTALPTKRYHPIVALQPALSSTRQSAFLIPDPA